MIACMVDDGLDLFESSSLSSGQKVMFCGIKVQISLVLPAPLKNVYNSHEGCTF